METWSDRWLKLDMKRLNLTPALVLVALSAILVACVSRLLPSASPAATLSIVGVLRPWTEGTPIEERRIALCRSLGDPRDGLCELLPLVAVSDRQGRFHFNDVPEGVYFLLYDSGLSDFDEAMANWAGQTLHFGDQDWLSTFLGVEIEPGDIDYRMPDGITLSPNVNWLSSYCLLTLLVGESPFIIAHDLQSATHDRELHCAIIDVSPGQTTHVDFEVLYYGD